MTPTPSSAPRQLLVATDFSRSDSRVWTKTPWPAAGSAQQDASDHHSALVDGHSLQPRDFTLSLTEGNALAHILGLAAGRPSDPIVSGKRGRRTAEDVLPGSVTRHALAESPCDPLVSALRT